MKKKKVFRLNSIITFVLFSFLAVFMFGCSRADYSDFASCLTDKGVVFYGSKYCSHCNNVKSRFGDAMMFVNYVECSDVEGGQTKECEDKNIKYYPTFMFSDGSQLNGAVEFNILSMKAGCPLPVE